MIKLQEELLFSTKNMSSHLQTFLVHSSRSICFALSLVLLSLVPVCPFVQAFEIPPAPTTKPQQEEIKQLLRQGVQQLNMKQYPQALEMFQQALEQSRRAQNRGFEGISLYNIAGVYLELRQYGNALDFYQQALSIQRKVRNKSMEGTTLNKMGLIYQNLGQYGKALDSYQQGLHLHREVRDREMEGAALNNIGSVHRDLGQYDDAINVYQQALSIFHFLQDRKAEGTTLNNIGLAYQNLGQHNKALKYYQQALSIRRKVKDRQGEGTTLNNIGLAYQNLGQHNKALDVYQQALSIVREVQDRSLEGTILNNIGLVYQDLEQYDNALDVYQQALSIVREVQDPSREAITLNNIGTIFFRMGNFSAAEKSLYESINTYELLRPGLSDLQKVSIADAQADAYGWLQRALVAQKKLKSALEISERGRTRAFIELLASRIAPHSSQRLNELNQSPSITQIQQIAKAQGATLVQYSIVSNQDLYIWVVQPNGQIHFRKTERRSTDVSFHNSVEMSRGTIDARGQGQGAIIEVRPTGTNPLKQQLRTLHHLLIDPISDLLPKNPNERVIFIPHRSFFLVPFPALMDVKGKYLIEQHTILTAPSIQVLSLTQQQAKKARTRETLVVGNPVMPKLRDGSLSPLPGSEQEAKNVAALLKTQPLIGSRATKSEVMTRMSQARIIHLATHGLLERYDGIPGAIALAPDRPNRIGDGLLSSTEIFDLKLNAELVVLSACDTGRGNVTGDGVIGLSRSFIAAGVPSVIVSLWQVPDTPTAALMTEFYRNLRDQRLDKAQSLRQAMLTTLKKHPNPRDWAAFTLIGEAD
jgi:CHAT domain-containing protein/Tfp pilus assembly protein PilF